MKVVDAGVVVDLLAGSLEYDQLGDEELAVPHLIDSEVLNVLRSLVRRNALSDERGAFAVAAFLRLSLTRFPVDALRPRIWELRHNYSAYDATYIALTEFLDADALVTTDARLARAPGAACRIELLP